METIEEQARKWAYSEMPFGDKTNLIKGYVQGANDQKEIYQSIIRFVNEDGEMLAYNREQRVRKEMIDKACKTYCDVCYNRQSGCEELCNDINVFRKAMEG